MTTTPPAPAEFDEAAFEKWKDSINWNDIFAGARAEMGARWQHAQLSGEIAAMDKLAADWQAQFADAVEERDRLKAEVEAYRRTANSFESRLHEATKAGTPYWHERDAMNAQVIENHRLREENDRLRQALERITKLFHAAHDNNGSAMDAVGEMAAVARKALAGGGAEET